MLLPIALIVAVLVVLVPLWRIFSRLGFSPLYSLAMLIPFVNIGMLYYIAFMDWPAHPEPKQDQG